MLHDVTFRRTGVAESVKRGICLGLPLAGKSVHGIYNLALKPDCLALV